MSLRRHAKRTDSNQAEIVDALRYIGCDVWIIGRPLDLLVWSPMQGKYHLVEVKNPDGFNRLTADQERFKENWRGPWSVVRSIEEALDLVESR